MKVFRYETTGGWFKGNTHIHSTASDGGMTFTQLAELYAGGGYDFLFRTDHWVASDVASDKAAAGDPPVPLLWLDGIELDGNDDAGAAYHVVCLGLVRGMAREMGLEAGLAAARRQGAMCILAHPHWTGNTLDDTLRHDFDGVEVYNHVCRFLNGKSDGAIHWTAMLAENPNVLAFAADDAHLWPGHHGWNGGWVMVNASACTAEAITAALRAGNFYSSCGPEIRSIECRGNQVRVETSPVQFVRLVGPAWNGRPQGAFGGPLLTEASFELPADWPWIWLEMEDIQGRRAWTNPLYRI
ncbi:MAG: hypothetical protein M1457_13600 [bacterium]|nr:hypothetical protein [bacterium]